MPCSARMEMLLHLLWCRVCALPQGEGLCLTYLKTKHIYYPECWEYNL